MDIERRTIAEVPNLEYREDSSTGKTIPVLRGYAAVFNSESRNLGGFVEVIEPRAFDKVLAQKPDVYALFNHDRNLILGNTTNDTLKLSVDSYGLRYEAFPDDTSVARDVSTWVKNRTVKASSFAFAVDRNAANGGEKWEAGPRGLRKRTVTDIALLDDVSVVTRPAYDASSVVVSRRALEMALGEAYRPNQTMANSSKRGLKIGGTDKNVDTSLISLAERIAERQIIVAEDVQRLSEVMVRCAAAKNAGWSGSLPWIEWQLAGGDSGEKWIQRRMAELVAGDEPDVRKAIADIDFSPPEGVRKEAARGLEWRKEFNRGGTAVGVARARDLSNGTKIGPDTARRMVSYFARHEVDKKGQGWSQGEEGFPSAGRIAWALWGGDPGRSWANSLVEQMNAGGERAANLPDEYPDDDDSTLSSYENTDMTERDMALCAAYRDIGTKMGPWDESDLHYLDESTGTIMCRSKKVVAEAEGTTAMGAMDNMNAAPKATEQRNEPENKSDPAPAEPDVDPAAAQKRRDEAEVIAAIASLEAIVLGTHLHGGDVTL
jgi:hypothetical protein